MSEKKCKRIFHPNLQDGWGCCECKTYNGIQRIKCKWCEHPPCYTEIEVVEVDDDA